MTLGKIANAARALQKVTNMDLPVRSLYQISMLMSQIEPQLKFYDCKHTEILEKYCERDDKGYKIIPENREVLEREINELGEIDAGEIITIEIPESDTICMSYADLVALDGIVKINFKEE